MSRTKIKKAEIDPTLTLPPPVSGPRVLACPAPARAIIQQRIDAVRLTQRQLRETVDAVAAGLGIDGTKEKWDFDADRGVFTQVP